MLNLLELIGMHHTYAGAAAAMNYCCANIEILTPHLVDFEFFCMLCLVQHAFTLKSFALHE